MNDKRALFERFHKKMEQAKRGNFCLEASWYAYAIVEDRLDSVLRQSGGIGRNGGSAPIRMPNVTSGGVRLKLLIRACWN